MPAKFFDHEVRSGLKNKRVLSAFLEDLLKKKKKGLESCRLNFIFCKDEYLLHINTSYLKHETLTDIITFDLSPSRQEMEGEIYISTERVQENALKFNTTYNEELHRVIFHGVLHLCGFKDKTKAEQAEMRKQEYLCLKKYLNIN